MQSAKETVSSIGASAKAGMEKTKATMQEKGEKMTTRDPLEKEMARQKKEERIQEAERQKQETRQHNAATRQAASTGGHTGVGYTAGGDYSTEQNPTGTGYTAEGVRSDYPQGVTEGGLGTGTGTGGVTPQDPNVGGGAGTGYGSGTTY